MKDNISYLIESILLGSSRNVRVVTMFRAVVDAGDKEWTWWTENDARPSTSQLQTTFSMQLQAHNKVHVLR